METRKESRRGEEDAEKEVKVTIRREEQHKVGQK